MTFLEFKVEPHNKCNYDKLIIYDGSTTAATAIGTFCSFEVPKPIKSTGKSVLLYFETDSSVEYNGFKFNYSPKPYETASKYCKNVNETYII